MDEILRIVRALQVSDDNGVAIPENWPHNELIEDEVMLPPPTDEKTARECLEKFQCYDWWLCHKKLEQ